MLQIVARSLGSCLSPRPERSSKPRISPSPITRMLSVCRTLSMFSTPCGRVKLPAEEGANAAKAKTARTGEGPAERLSLKWVSPEGADERANAPEAVDALFAVAEGWIECWAGTAPWGYGGTRRMRTRPGETTVNARL